MNDKRIPKALKIFDQLIPALQDSLRSLEGLSQEEAGRRLRRYQVELFASIQGDLEFYDSSTWKTP
ncbi:MAG: hypothetical protein HC904_11140 [Blastochloris sp.]|nr:hypothetical protein [Blastochloris sp.]